jgi:class 3 adenylate cyclase
MCASGLPKANDENAKNAVMAALDMQQFIKEFCSANKIQNLPVFEVRIGIHTGPIVAGVVGSKKFAYDIWGDTVNQASQMEQLSDPGKVNISSDTFKLIKNDFRFTDRGRVETKSKGNVEMYFVDGLI